MTGNNKGIGAHKTMNVKYTCLLRFLWADTPLETCYLGKSSAKAALKTKRNVTPMKSRRFAETRDSQAMWWSAVKLVTVFVHAVVCSYIQSHTCNRIQNLSVKSLERSSVFMSNNSLLL